MEGLKGLLRVRVPGRAVTRGRRAGGRAGRPAGGRAITHASVACIHCMYVCVVVVFGEGERGKGGKGVKRILASARVSE